MLAQIHSCAPTAVYELPEGSIRRIGEWLVRRGLIDRVQLFTALDASYRHGCRLGDALVWLELVDRGRLEAEVRRYHAFREGSEQRASDRRASLEPPAAAVLPREPCATSSPSIREPPAAR
jgi:hypothetical protein